MMRFALVIAAVVLLSAAACDGETAVFGEVMLEAGYVGDVRGSRVELYETNDLSGEPVAFAISETGSNVRRSSFRLAGVPPGRYYLLAWRDVDEDGRISNGDLVGVGGGSYRPGFGGGVVEVFAGAATDVRVINMQTWRDPVRSLEGGRSTARDTTEFRLVFNYDLELTSMAVQFPGLGVFLDPDAPGLKVAGAVYLSGGWTRGGGEMPRGRHLVNLTGRLDGQAFNITVPVDIP